MFENITDVAKIMEVQAECINKLNAIFGTEIEYESAIHFLPSCAWHYYEEDGEVAYSNLEHGHVTLDNFKTDPDLDYDYIIQVTTDYEMYTNDEYVLFIGNIEYESGIYIFKKSLQVE